MRSHEEIAKSEFYTLYNNLYAQTDDYQEDCQLTAFCELLYNTEVIDSPVQTSRQNGKLGNTNWSLLGFNQSCLLNTEESEETTEHSASHLDSAKREWSYTLFNGFFSQELSVEKARLDEINKCIKETVSFVKNILSNKLIKDVSAARSLQNEIKESINNGELDRITIYIVTDKIITQSDLPKSIPINDSLSINVHYWDIRKWGELKRNKLKRAQIDIDLRSTDFADYSINYVKRKVATDLTQYLAFFPAQLLADLYDYYNTGLLENNVRVFLSAGRKANKAIRDTIKNDPDKFFSFNNGISSTAASIQIEDGNLSKIDDFQIVNGGQTTATIHYARKIDKYDLSKVYVPVKITELKKDNNYSKVVGAISKAANTQSAIRSSDFYANHPFLVGVERLSKKLSVLAPSGDLTFYFFERMSGQYNVTLNNSGRNKKFQDAWRQSHPKEMSYTKIDIARWFNCLQELPHIAALSAEKQFTEFIDEKNYNVPKITGGGYKDLIGFGLIFMRIRQLIGKKNGKVYPSIIGDSSVGMATAIYAATLFHIHTDKRFDYWKIYDQGLSVADSLVQPKIKTKTEIDSSLILIIKQTWKLLSDFGKSSVQEQTKKLECWIYVQQNFNGSAISRDISAFIINKSEQKLREQEDDNLNEEEEFEKIIIDLLSNSGRRLIRAYEIAQRETKYRGEKVKLFNLIKKVKSQESILTLKRLKDAYKFTKQLELDGYDMNSKVNDVVNPGIKIIEKLSRIEGLLSRSAELIDNYETNALSNDDIDLDNAQVHLNRFRYITDVFSRERGLSFNHIEEITQLVELLDN